MTRNLDHVKMLRHMRTQQNEYENTKGVATPTALAQAILSVFESKVSQRASASSIP